MAESSEVVANAQALASEYNNLRKDVLDPTLGHSHTGAVDEGAFMNPVVVSKASDETVNNSTALQDDDDLLLPVGANEIWVVELTIRFTTHTDANFKYIFTLPAAGAFKGIDTELVTDTTLDYYAPVDLATEQVQGTATVTHAWILVKGVYVGAGTAGNVQLQWAQQAAYGGDTKVLKGSYLIAHKVS